MNRILVAALLAAACATPAPPPADSSPADTTPVQMPRVSPSGGDQAWDLSIVAQLERDARRLASAEGCDDVSACRAAPLGVKACGGPRDYIVYCSATTDSVALYRKLDELARAERAYNEKYGIMSTCELRLAPDLALVGRGCRATR